MNRKLLVKKGKAYVFPTNCRKIFFDGLSKSILAVDYKDINNPINVYFPSLTGTPSTSFSAKDLGLSENFDEIFEVDSSNYLVHPASYSDKELFLSCGDDGYLLLEFIESAYPERFCKKAEEEGKTVDEYAKLRLKLDMPKKIDHYKVRTFDGKSLGKAVRFMEGTNIPVVTSIDGKFRTYDFDRNAKVPYLRNINDASGTDVINFFTDIDGNLVPPTSARHVKIQDIGDGKLFFSYLVSDTSLVFGTYDITNGKRIFERKLDFTRSVQFNYMTHKKAREELFERGIVPFKCCGERLFKIIEEKISAGLNGTAVLSGYVNSIVDSKGTCEGLPSTYDELSLSSDGIFVGITKPEQTSDKTTVSVIKSRLRMSSVLGVESKELSIKSIDTKDKLSLRFSTGTKDISNYIIPYEDKCLLTNDSKLYQLDCNDLTIKTSTDLVIKSGHKITALPDGSFKTVNSQGTTVFHSPNGNALFEASQVDSKGRSCDFKNYGGSLGKNMLVTSSEVINDVNGLNVKIIADTNGCFKTFETIDNVKNDGTTLFTENGKSYFSIDTVKLLNTNGGKINYELKDLISKFDNNAIEDGKVTINGKKFHKKILKF